MKLFEKLQKFMIWWKPWEDSQVPFGKSWEDLENLKITGNKKEMEMKRGSKGKFPLQDGQININQDNDGAVVK